MKIARLLFPLALLALISVAFLRAEPTPEPAGTAADPPKPLKALLIAGGCCHDYVKQHEVLFKGIQARAKVQVDVMWTRDKSTNPPLPVYDNDDWAEGYDIIIHDECAANNKDLKAMERILKVHETIPAVHLHCAMHSFRNGTDQWPKHLGLHSTGHGPQKPLEITYTNENHPITKGLENWTTQNEELYNNREVFDIEPLALATQKVKDRENTAIVAWTNTKSGAPSFSTTIGHNTYTVEDPRYLDLVTRGLLWAAGKLTDDYLQPYTGENVVTEMSTEKKPPKIASAKPPKDATLVKVSASSTQTSDGHYPWKAIDGETDTRWTANGASHPAWLQLEFLKPATVTSAEILWEMGNEWYHYKIETSTDGKTWTLAHDGSKNTRQSDTKDQFEAKDIKFLRVTTLGQESGKWPALWELRLTGPQGPLKLFPVLAKGEKAKAGMFDDSLKKSGNIKPTIPKLTPEEEQAILKDVEVPEGFDVSLFANWQSANYPVYVAASPGGDLYVSSDGNGSLGRDPHRGRVLRLRDTDQDGRADEVTEFIPDIDSPRGLIWDHDRLYLLHPPHISVFFDRDHDGVAEESKRLISDIAFGFKDRPADHTTNGLELGIDGWIYIAGGDFGFMKATGTDARTLQHRGGGVIRFRPDGSGLELYSTGTRNILATPMSPTLDLFARDNTNDGGGWDVRFHHFTPLSDHGYPRLYMNFGKEHIQPLADYGGGSGCGGVYIHEPGFPAEWNKAPFTCDWGKAGLFRHSVEPDGATFKETEAPQRFIKVTRPTDADVDGMSAVYQASWKGPATFGWAGPNQGYIVRVTPKGYTPEPLPDFEKMSDEELVKALKSPSHVRTLAAQRALIRRDPTQEIRKQLENLILLNDTDLSHRVAALYAAVQMQPGAIAIPWTRTNPNLDPFLARAFGEFPDVVFMGSVDDGTTTSFSLIKNLMMRGNPRTILEGIASLAKSRPDFALSHGAPLISPHLASKDPVIRHTAYRALAKMSAHDAAFAWIDHDDIEIRKAAAWALMRMHKPEVVNRLISRLATEEDIAKRRPLLSTLARLYHTEAEWKGDSWGTRPDTRGPYYQPTTWEQSERIVKTLKTILKDAPPEEASFIIYKLNKNRIPADGALEKLVDLALEDDSLIPQAIKQLAASNSIPPKALPLVIQGTLDPEATPESLADAVKILINSDDREALSAALTALVRLDTMKEAGKSLRTARNHFFKAPKLENHHLALEKLAAEAPATPKGQYAAMAVVTLASRKGGSPESREMSVKAIARGWSDPRQKLTFIKAATELRNPLLNDKIRVALSNPDPKIAKAAGEAAKRLKIQAPGEDQTPKIASLKPADAIKKVTAHKGDIALGEAIFARATCNACHTVTQDDPQKGPYLGNITETYRRHELAEAILVPNKTIAQGFATNVFALKDDRSFVGFVTNEAGDTVTIRDIASNEHQFKKSEIKERSTVETSLMPPGLMAPFTVHEMASLLDYLESLQSTKE